MKLFIKLNMKTFAFASLISVLVIASNYHSNALNTYHKQLFRRQTQPEVIITTTTPSSLELPTTQQPPPTTTSQKPPILPVNFTKVDELFNAPLSEHETLAKWMHMDKQLIAAVRSLLKVIFPHVVAMSSDAKVSGNCSGAILKWILNLRNLRSWAFKMLDATGKPQAGILDGSLTFFGNYRQCLSIRAPDEDEIELVDEFREYFRGKYCVLQLKPYLPKRNLFLNLNSTIQTLSRFSSYKYYEKTVYDELSELAAAFYFVNVRADLCVPSLCSRDDIQRVADFLSKQTDMKAKVLRCDTEPLESQILTLSDYSIVSCVYTIVFGLIVVLVIVSSLIHFVVLNLKEKPTTNSILTSMSLYKSLSYVKNIQLERLIDTKPSFLYAIRLLVVLWMLLVSLVSDLDFQFMRNLLPLRSIIMRLPMQLLVNSNLAYDTLIYLTAFTYSYVSLSNSTSGKDLAKYCATKYARLTPSIMFIVALTLIKPLLYEHRSPIWLDFVDNQAEVCRLNGWQNLFFIQNLLSSYSNICIPQTWLFCIELQLCIVTLPLVRNLCSIFDKHRGKIYLKSATVWTLASVSLIGCIINFANIYTNSLPATWFLTYPDKLDKDRFFTQHVIKTYTHLTPFFIGLLAGYVCRCKSIDTFSGRPYGRSLVNTLMLLSSFVCMSILVLCLHSYSLQTDSHLKKPLVSALYAAFAPFAWSLSLSLMFFYLLVPNAKNQYPLISVKLFQCKSLIRLGRLSFLVYLLGPYVTNFVYAIQETPVFGSALMLFHTFIGNLVLTFGLAFVVSILVELPCRRLAKKALIGRPRHSSNFDIITRQLNIRAKNLGPSHDSFTSSNNNTNSDTSDTLPSTPNDITSNLPLKTQN